jgi:hypothetical protein
MADFDNTTLNAALDAIEVSIGTAPTLRIRSGAKPATPGTADAGVVIAAIVLPSDWLAGASGAVKSKSGTWTDSSADNAGTAGHFRIYDSGGTCRVQGTITATGGGGDMELDNTVLTAGQEFQVTNFDFTAVGG